MTSIGTNTPAGQDGPETQARPRPGFARVALLVLKICQPGMCFAVAMAIYVLTCTFWQYLSSGSVWGAVGPSLNAYRQALIAPLGEMFQGPVSIFNYPWMIVIIGLTLGVMILAPLVVAIMYRLWAGMALLAVAALIGHVPVLAVTLAMGCLLATRTSLRNDMPLLSAIIGTIPAGLYLYLFSFAGGDCPGILPMQRWIPYAPFAVAAVCALVTLTAIMALSHLTTWRLGLLWPAMSIMLLASLYLFNTRVGTAELQYTLIAGRLAGGCTIFQPSLLDNWRRANKADKLDQAAISKALQRELRGNQDDLIAACDRFLTLHPSHGRAPAVLWIKAQCQSLQLDQLALHTGTINFTDNYPLESSRQAWEELSTNFAAAPQAALAQWHLGELALRRGNVKQATEYLNSAGQHLWANSAGRQQDQQDQQPKLFSPLESLPAGQSYEQARIEVDRLTWLISVNKLADDSVALAKMSQYLSLNPFSQHYAQELAGLIKSPPDTAVSRNIMVALARVTSDYRTKVDILNTVLTDGSDADACVEANYELATLSLQQPVLAQQLNLKSPGDYFNQVARIMPNPWQAEAFRYQASTQPGQK
jgi:hypothetical protein